MPYITTERVKEVRNQLKKEFPKFKFSVTRQHFSTIRIVVLKSKFAFDLDGRSYMSVNPYYVRDHYKDAKQAKFLQRIVDIAEQGNATVTIDGDYGAIPKFYVDILIGDFEKPYQVL
jgi:hypothetical protein